MRTLVNTAIGVAFAGVTAIVYVQLKQLDEISNSTYFKEAFKILRGHAGKTMFCSCTKKVMHNNKLSQLNS